MGKELWDSVEELGSSLSTTPVVQDMCKELPRNQNGPLAKLLAEFQSGGIKIGSLPFRAGNLTHFAPQVIGRTERAPDETMALFDLWATDAASVTALVLRLVQWLRSRLPGYPNVAPQLCPGSPLMVPGLGGEFVWKVGERSKGLEKTSAPSKLGASFSSTASSVKDATVQLGEALQKSKTWLRLSRAFDALGDDDKAQLSGVRSLLRKKLSEDSLDAYERDNLLRRIEYRVHTVSKELELLNGNAREYAFAFRDAEELLTLTMDVAGQFAAYGPPVVLNKVSELQFDPGPPRIVSFVLNEAPILDLYRLVRFSDPLVSETLLVVQVTINFTRTHGQSQKVTARILE